MSKNTKMTSLAVLSALIVVMLPEISLADDFGQALCNVRELFSGQVGAAIATLAIIFLGVSAFFGKVTWGLALMVAAGIAAIFGADTLVTFVSEGAEECA